MDNIGNIGSDGDKTCNQRLRQAVKYLKLTHQQFAEAIGVSRVYVTKLLTEEERKMSAHLAATIENKFGISADWLLSGVGQMLSTYTKIPELTPKQRRLTEQLERLDDRQLNAVLAFMDTLERLETENEAVKRVNKVEEYAKFLEWQNSQKEKK